MHAVAARQQQHTEPVTMQGPMLVSWRGLRRCNAAIAPASYARLSQQHLECASLCPGPKLAAPVCIAGTIFPGRSRTEPAAAGADNDASTGSDTTLPDGSVPADTTVVEIIPTLGLGPFVNGTVGNDTLLNSTLCNGTLGNDTLGNATIGNITLCNSTLAGFDSSNVTVLSPLLAGNSSTEGPVGAVQGFVVGVQNQTVGEVLRGGVAGAANQTVGAIRTGVVGAANQTVGAIRSQVAGAIQNVTSAIPTAADVTRGINDRLASALGAPLAGLLTTSGGASPNGK